MTIASELTKLQGHVTDAYEAVEDMGGTIPAAQTMKNLPTAIGTIPTGGGGDIFDETKAATLGFSSAQAAKVNDVLRDDYALTDEILAEAQKFSYSSGQWRYNGVNVNTHYELWAKLLRQHYLPLATGSSGAFGGSTTRGVYGGFSYLPELKVARVNTGASTSMKNTFYYAVGLVAAFFEGSTSNVTDIRSCFQMCVSLRYVDLTPLVNVVNAASAFNECQTLETIDISPILTKATNVNTLFNNCPSLKSVTGFETPRPQLTNANSIFQNCYALESVDVSGLTAATSFGYQFNKCESLRQVTLPTTTVATNLNITFANCHNLENLDLSAFSNVQSMQQVCYGCASLQSLKLPSCNNLNGSGAFSSFLYGCTSLSHLDMTLITNSTAINYLAQASSSSPFTQVPKNCEITVTSADLKTLLETTYSFTNVIMA